MKKQRFPLTRAMSEYTPRPLVPRRPVFAGVGRLRKIAMVGGAGTIRHVPWDDPTWEIWSHHSCRHQCGREPDLLFDLHPPELWRDADKKFWDPRYPAWLKATHTPIMMQQKYPDAPTSIKYPFESMVTEFPRGYHTNTLSYMIPLALMEGVTHIGIFGCHYDAGSEYGPQRGSAEYWLGVAEGRGVHVLIPPGCDLLNRPSLLYGYESHPNGVRDPSYSFTIGPGVTRINPSGLNNNIQLLPADGLNAPKLMEPPMSDMVLPDHKKGPWKDGK
jgi:hypothetical protein